MNVHRRPRNEDGEEHGEQDYENKEGDPEEVGCLLLSC